MCEVCGLQVQPFEIHYSGLPSTYLFSHDNCDIQDISSLRFAGGLCHCQLDGCKSQPDSVIYIYIYAI